MNGKSVNLPTIALNNDPIKCIAECICLEVKIVRNKAFAAVVDLQIINFLFSVNQKVLHGRGLPEEILMHFLKD